MKSLFGNKKANHTGGGCTDLEPPLPPSQHPSPHGTNQQQQHSNSKSNKESLIESLRSVDTLSAASTPVSIQTTSSNVSKTTNHKSHRGPMMTTSTTSQPPQQTNPQQTNKKLFGTRHYNTGSSSINRKDPTTGPLPPPQQPSSIGYTTSLDATTSFSTANVSLMVPPSQQRRHNHQHKAGSHRTLLPPETVMSTSQQQYRPPPIMTIGTNDDSHAAGFVSNSQSITTLTYPRRSVYSTEQNKNGNQHGNATDEDPYHIMNDEDRLQDVVLHDGIDQDHYHRLLSPTNENANNNVNNSNNSNEHQSSKSLDKDDSDDDIVPFAACFARQSHAAPKNATLQHNSNNNDAAMTTVRFQNQNTTITDPNEIDTKIPHRNVCYAKFQYYFVRTGLIYALIVLFTAASMLYGLSDQLSYMNRHKHHKGKEITNIQVAFIGNAYLFVNDIPRLLESISQGFIYQNSCLHAGGSLSDLWVTGNGMYKLWQTDEATIEYAIRSSSSNNDDAEVTDDVVATDDDVSMATTYDYGYCSV